MRYLLNHLSVKLPWPTRCQVGLVKPLVKYGMNGRLNVYARVSLGYSQGLIYNHMLY